MTESIRPAAQVVHHASREPFTPPEGYFLGDADKRTIREYPRPDGQLWEREAERST